MIGVDVSKDKLDIYIAQTGKHQVISNTTKQISMFFQKLKDKQAMSMVVFEPTGCYSKELEVCCLKHDIRYHKANLNKVYYFAKSTVGYAKTDKIDATMLAAYAEKK